MSNQSYRYVILGGADHSQWPGANHISPAIIRKRESRLPVHLKGDEVLRVTSPPPPSTQVCKGALEATRPRQSGTSCFPSAVPDGYGTMRCPQQSRRTFAPTMDGRSAAHSRSEGPLSWAAGSGWPPGSMQGAPECEYIGCTSLVPPSRQSLELRRST